ncbi:MAG: hypothetical protein KGL39_12435 [Patescibacteria group bacterium]|nr:hypothetical protein [Patescibacteria group bacterium]
MTELPTGEQVSQVKIINKNDFTLIDHFDGVKFTFPPKKPVRVPVQVAAHIFGFRAWPKVPSDDPDDPESQVAQAIKYCAMRHGWNAPKPGTYARECFDNLEITVVKLHVVEEIDEGKRA